MMPLSQYPADLGEVVYPYTRSAGYVLTGAIDVHENVLLSAALKFGELRRLLRRPRAY